MPGTYGGAGGTSSSGQMQGGQFQQMLQGLPQTGGAPAQGNMPATGGPVPQQGGPTSQGQYMPFQPAVSFGGSGAGMQGPITPDLGQALVNQRIAGLQSADPQGIAASFAGRGFGAGSGAQAMAQAQQRIGQQAQIPGAIYDQNLQNALTNAAYSQGLGELAGQMQGTALQGQVGLADIGATRRNQLLNMIAGLSGA